MAKFFVLQVVQYSASLNAESEEKAKEQFHTLLTNNPRGLYRDKLDVEVIEMNDPTK
jgi:hypothetical protein